MSNLSNATFKKIYDEILEQKLQHYAKGLEAELRSIKAPIAASAKPTSGGAANAVPVVNGMLSNLANLSSNLRQGLSLGGLKKAGVGLTLASALITGGLHLAPEAKTSLKIADSAISTTKSIAKVADQPVKINPDLPTLLISAGHNTADSGAVSEGVTEASIALEFRNEISDRLKKRGYNVLTDGLGQENQTKEEAVSLAKRSQVAIEFHLNSSANREAAGVEVLGVEKDKKLSQSISKSISDVLGSPLRGDKGWKSQTESQHGAGGLYFVNQGKGVIVESFFLSNPKELEMYQLKKVELFDSIAEGIINGL